MKESNLLDPIQDSLDQSIFKGDQLKNSAQNFVETKIKQLLKDEFGFEAESFLHCFLTGSLTTLQWAKDSDFDLNIFVDWDAWPTYPTDPEQLRTQLVILFTHKLDGMFIPGSQHPIQTFILQPDVHPEDNFKPGVQAAWDFQTRSWFVPPFPPPVDNIEEQLPAMLLRAYRVADKMDTLLNTNPNAAVKLYKKIHEKRKRDIKRYGPVSEGNILYKYLYQLGMFDRLRNLGLRIASAPQVIGTVFVGPGQEGDFTWMAQQPEYANTLFVFNDNQEQFERHEAGDHSACYAGGGNAAIRPLQDENPPRAAGIPTGSAKRKGAGYDALDPEVQEVIDRALANIKALASSGNYDKIVYSDDGAGGLGTSIFQVHPDVKNYIVQGLKTSKTADLKDYEHWNEDQYYMWWMEEGRFQNEPPEYDPDWPEYDREYDPGPEPYFEDGQEVIFYDKQHNQPHKGVIAEPVYNKVKEQTHTYEDERGTIHQEGDVYDYYITDSNGESWIVDGDNVVEFDEEAYKNAVSMWWGTHTKWDPGTGQGWMEPVMHNQFPYTGKPPEIKQSSPWINRAGEPLSWDEDEPPDWLSEDEYEWTDEDVPDFDEDAFIWNEDGWNASLARETVDGLPDRKYAIRVLERLMNKAGYFPNTWEQLDRYGYCQQLHIQEELAKDLPEFKVGDRIILDQSSYGTFPELGQIINIKKDEDLNYEYKIRILMDTDEYKMDPNNFQTITDFEADKYEYQFEIATPQEIKAIQERYYHNWTEEIEGTGQQYLGPLDPEYTVHLPQGYTPPQIGKIAHNWKLPTEGTIVFSDGRVVHWHGGGDYEEGAYLVEGDDGHHYSLLEYEHNWGPVGEDTPYKVIDYTDEFNYRPEDHPNGWQNWPQPVPIPGAYSPEYDKWVATYEQDQYYNEGLNFWVNEEFPGQGMMMDLDPNIDLYYQQAYGENVEPYDPPRIYPDERKSKVALDETGCQTQPDFDPIYYEVPDPVREPITAPQPVTAAEGAGYDMAPEWEGWKVVKVEEDGTMISPAQHTEWPYDEQGALLMQAAYWDAPEGASVDPNRVRNASGIHTINPDRDANHWGELQTYYRDDNFILIKCKLGSTVADQWKDAAKTIPSGKQRSKSAIPIMAVGINRELLLKVANKYKIDIEYVGEDRGQEGDNVIFRIDDPYGEEGQWEFIDSSPETVGGGQYKGFDFNDRYHHRDPTKEVIINDFQGKEQGRIQFSDWQKGEVRAINGKNSDLPEVIHAFMDHLRHPGIVEPAWDRDAFNESEEMMNGAYETAEREYDFEAQEKVRITDIDSLIETYEELNKNSYRFTEDNHGDSGEEVFRLSEEGDTDEYGLRYWQLRIIDTPPDEIDLTPVVLEAIFYQVINDLLANEKRYTETYHHERQNINSPMVTERPGQRIEEMAQAMWGVPAFLHDREWPQSNWSQIDIVTFFTRFLKAGWDYVLSKEPQEAPQEESLFGLEEVQAEPVLQNKAAEYFLQYLAQLVGTQRSFIPNKVYNPQPGEKEYGKPWENYNYQNLPPPQNPLIIPGTFSKVAAENPYQDDPIDKGLWEHGHQYGYDQVEWIDKDELRENLTQYVEELRKELDLTPMEWVRESPMSGEFAGDIRLEEVFEEVAERPMTQEEFDYAYDDYYRVWDEGYWDGIREGIEDQIQYMYKTHETPSGQLALPDAIPGFWEGGEPPKQSSLIDVSQILYDLNTDTIILGEYPKESSEEEDHIHLLGEYDGENAIFFPTHGQWFSPDYFKKLWAYSYTDKPLKDIFMLDDGEVVKLDTKLYRKRRTVHSAEYMSPGQLEIPEPSEAANIYPRMEFKGLSLPGYIPLEPGDKGTLIDWSDGFVVEPDKYPLMEGYETLWYPNREKLDQEWVFRDNRLNNWPVNLYLIDDDGMPFLSIEENYEGGSHVSSVGEGIGSMLARIDAALLYMTEQEDIPPESREWVHEVYNKFKDDPEFVDDFDRAQEFFKTPYGQERIKPLLNHMPPTPDGETQLEHDIHYVQSQVQQLEDEPKMVAKCASVIMKLSDWRSVEEKAKRYLDGGQVDIENNLYNYINGTVHGDNGDYETQIWRDDPSSRAITTWNCTCPWGQVSWGRTRQFKRYEGRPCAHCLSLFWASRSVPLQDDESGPGPGGGSPSPEQPTIPGAHNLPVQPDEEQEEPEQPEEPEPPIVSAPTQFGDNPTGVNLPGALSKVGELLDKLIYCYAPGDYKYHMANGNDWATLCGKPVDRYEAGIGVNSVDFQYYRQKICPLCALIAERPNLDYDFPSTASAPIEPPNYREQDTPNENCKLCKMMYKGKCWGYGNIPVEPDMVCDSFTPETKKESMAQHEEWKPGDKAFFEYHCWENEKSADAELWHHTHQPVTVLGFDPKGEWANGLEGTTIEQRLEYANPATYRVRFEDGFEWTVFEDELTDDPSDYYRPDYRISAVIFNNGDTVKVKPGVTLQGEDREGEVHVVNEGTAGEVLWADLENAVVIFPLKSHALEPHLVRVECTVDQLYKATGKPFGF